LASNFSDEHAVDAPREAARAEPVGGVDVPSAALSPAVDRFRSCRWRRPPEDGSECCTHRDVLPMAGATSFNPEAWCPGCEHFKAKRAPRKRQERNDYW
jgi:hypothetical protein